ncbi:MAG: RNA methyltransferase [Lachnospiraceae bacterium]|nr:RNA methyltransferase [Lachnospiraceae bacterium]
MEALGGGLPKAFVEKMECLLGEEAEAFFESFCKKRKFGLRLNPLKSADSLPGLPVKLEKIPWTAEGYYYEETLRPGKHPLHEAGLYYIQEPSAMAAAEALGPQPGERILDLCAAPGGKSTHIAGKMRGQGLLVCNEIHPARAKILSQNIERLGIANAVVTNVEPEGLVPAFSGFFDGILVDAPCSGEGMFRKDKEAVGEWSPERVKICAARQDAILACAAGLLRPGGRLVYSTCTFSPEENERTVAHFLKTHPEFTAVRPDCADWFEGGRPAWAGEPGSEQEIARTVRIWPHKAGGEGHFLALLVKNQAAAAPLSKERRGKKATKEKKREAEELAGFLAFGQAVLKEPEAFLKERKPVFFGENLYLLPKETPPLADLRVLRPGLHAGTQKKGRFEPSHALALFLKKTEVLQTLELGTGEKAERYLRGEALGGEVSAGEKKGWVLVTFAGCSAGWVKASGGVFKNHYPKGLRRA